MQADHENLSPLTPELLCRYREHAWQQVKPLMRVALTAAACLFAAFVGWELVVAPEVLPETVPLRVVSAGGMLLWLLGMRVPPLSRHPAIVLHGGATWAAASVSFLVGALPHSIGSSFVVGSLTLIILALATVTPSLLHHLVACALVWGTSNFVAVAWASAPGDFLIAANIFLVSSTVFSAVLVHHHARMRLRTFRLEARLQSLASTDSLTGALNRRALLAAAEEARRRSERYGEPLSLVMLDIDHFKSFNDTWGHPAGDEVIRAVAQRCTTAARETDLIGRLGGEEFVIVLPHSSGCAAAQMAERLREEIASTPVDIGGHLLNVTVSLGIAQCQPGEALDAWFARADGALYGAKRSGRNRIATDVPALAGGQGLASAA
ncbi:MAG: diguanylate cyclase [Myxococcaceae bacterium]